MLTVSDLLEKIIHHIEGVEVHHHRITWHKDKKLIGTLIESKSCGTERWIANVYERQILSAFDLVAVIFFRMGGLSHGAWHTITLDQEKKLVESWATELIKSAQSAEIKAVDWFTLLPFDGDLTKLEWAFKVSDADLFLNSRGIQWKCSDTVEHMYRDTFPEEDEFKSKAHEPPTGPTSECITPNESAVKEAQPWQNEARRIATDLCIENELGKTIENTLTIKFYSKNVRSAMLDEFVQDKQAYRQKFNLRKDIPAEGTITREALQGDRWFQQRFRLATEQQTRNKNT